MPAALAAIGDGFASAPPVRLLTARAARRSRPRPRGLHARRPAARPRRRAARRRPRGRRADRPRAPHGLHPHVGAIDVVPIVHLDDARRGAACAEALVVADRLADELGAAGLPLRPARRRAHARRAAPRRDRASSPSGCAPASSRRTSARPRRTRRPGAVLVAARPPLVAFNLELAPPATLEDARRIAAAIREGGPRRPAGRPRDRARSSPTAAASRRSRPTSRTTARCRSRRCSRRSRGTPPVTEAELVGLAPAAAFDGWPDGRPGPQPRDDRGRAAIALNA